MTVPGYPTAAPELAFSQAERLDLVVGEDQNDTWHASAESEADERISRWSSIAASALHAELHSIAEASTAQLDVLSKLLSDAGVDVDFASWTQELDAKEAQFAWASAAESCVLVILDWAADSAGTFDAHLIPKLATSKANSDELTRASGLRANHHEYAVKVSWEAMAPTFVNVQLLYRGRCFIVRNLDAMYEVLHYGHGERAHEHSPSTSTRAR